MRTNNLAWIIAIVMAVVAILSWVYNLDSNDGISEIQTVTVEMPDTELTGEIESLQNKVDDLSLAHRGLIEENTALRTLNENLKGELSGTSSEIEQLIQQLDQANIENNTAKAELESILAKVQNGEMKIVVPETVVSTSTPQSSESQQMIEQLERTVSNLREKVQTLSAELEVAKARELELKNASAQMVESQPDSSTPAVTEQTPASDQETENSADARTAEPQPDSSTPAVTEQAPASDQETENSADARTAEPQPDSSTPAVTEQAPASDQETENSADARTAESQSDSSIPDATEQILVSDPENAQSANVQTENIADVHTTQSQTEYLELNEKVQTLTADLGTAIAHTANLQSKISDLNAEVLYLTAELEIASAGTDKLQSDKSDLNTKVQDLLSKLEISNTQTTNLQTENSELNKKIQTLTADLGVANAQNFSLQTVNEDSLAEKSQLETDLSDSRQANDALVAENMSLQNIIQNLTVALNHSNVELVDTKANVEYLSTRLRYASKHLRRIRKQIRTTESDTDALISFQKELTATLSDELQDKQTQMERLISDYSAITLESDVVYESGSARLNERGFSVLAKISEQLLNFPGRIVSVEGHTDSKQISARLAQFYPTNWELSAARAAAAANYLIEQGVPEGSVRVVGYGPLRPIASNDSDEGRAANRRIEIRLVPELAERIQN